MQLSTIVIFRPGENWVEEMFVPLVMELFPEARMKVQDVVGEPHLVGCKELVCADREIARDVGVSMMALMKLHSILKYENQGVVSEETARELRARFALPGRAV